MFITWPGCHFYPCAYTRPLLDTEKINSTAIVITPNRTEIEVNSLFNSGKMSRTKLYFTEPYYRVPKLRESYYSMVNSYYKII